MRPICAVFGSLAFLSVATSAVQAEGRDRAGSLDWQTFKVPEYGTRVEYPAGIFAAVGEAEKGVGQRFESDDGHAVLSVYARENEDGATHPAVISGRTCGSPPVITNGSRVLSLRFPWNGMGQSIIADAISRILPAVPYIVSTWCIRRRKSGLGILL